MGVQILRRCFTVEEYYRIVASPRNASRLGTMTRFIHRPLSCHNGESCRGEETWRRAD
jgi:hypothetical protein